MFFVKKDSSTWGTISKAYIKTATSTWSPIKKIFIKVSSNFWQQFWPKSGPYTTTPPYFSTTSSGISISSANIGDTVYGINGVWNSNGQTITSYSYKLNPWSSDAPGGTLGTTISNGTFTSYQSFTLSTSSFDGVSIQSLYDNQYLSFDVTANTSSGINGSSSSDENGYRLYVTKTDILTKGASTNKGTNSGFKLGDTVTYTGQWDGREKYCPDLTGSVAWYRSQTDLSGNLSIATILQYGTLIKTDTYTGANSYSASGNGTTFTITSTYTTLRANGDSGAFFYIIDTQKNSSGITRQQFVNTVVCNDPPTVVTYPSISGTPPSGYYKGTGSTGIVVGATITGNTGTYTPTPKGTNPVASYFKWSSSSSTGYDYIYQSPGVILPGTTQIQDTLQNQNHSFTLPSSIYDSGGTQHGTITGYLEYFTIVENGNSYGNFNSSAYYVYPLPVSSNVTSVTASSSTTISFSYGTSIGTTDHFQLQYSTDNSTWTTLSATYYPSGSQSGTYTNITVPSTTSTYYYRLICYNADNVYMYGPSYTYNPTPGALTNFLVKSFFNGNVTAFYTTSTNTASVDIKSYYQVGSIGTYVPSATNYVNVSNNTAYSYSMSSSGSYQNTVLLTPYYGANGGNPAGSVQSLYITPTGQDAMTVSFGTPTVSTTSFTQSWTCSGPVSYYTIDVQRNGASIAGYPIYNSSSTSVTYNGGSAGQTYSVVVIPIYQYASGVTYSGVAQSTTVTLSLGSFTINNVTDSSVAPATISAPTLTPATGAGINNILFDWASSIPSDTASYGVTVWGPGMGSGTWTQASPFTTTGRTSINLYDITTTSTGIYDYYLPIATSANNSSVSAYVTATGNNKSVNVTWGSSTGANSYVVNYTITGGTGNGTFNSSALTGNSYTYDMSNNGGTFTLNSITAYSNSNGTGASITGTLPTTKVITPAVKTLQSSTASANFTYTDPSYTYAASNHLYFTTDGYIDFTASATGATLPTTGKIMPFYLADYVQESLKYATTTDGTNKYLILYWTGHRFLGGTTGELQFEIWFIEGQQYAYINYTAFPSGITLVNPIQYVFNGAAQNTATTGINSSNRQVKFYFNTTSNSVFANGTLFTPKTSSWGGWITIANPSSTDVGVTDISYPTGSGPNAPTSLSATATSSSITVSFTAPTSNGGSNISDYQYSTDNSTWTSAGSTSTSITVPNLSANTTYTVYIRALNYGGYTGSTASTNKTTSALLTGLTPTFATYSASNIISGGFTGTITNYDSNYTWTLSASNGSVAKGTASGTNLPFTVTGLTTAQSSTITVTASRTGYNDGSATTSFTAYPKVTKIVSTGGGTSTPYMSWAITLINAPSNLINFYTSRGTTSSLGTNTTATYTTLTTVTTSSGGANYYYDITITPYSGSSSTSPGTSGYQVTSTILKNSSAGVTVTDNY